MDLGTIMPEDYLDEHLAPLRNKCGGIPIPPIIEKLDEYLSRNDYRAAERHLRFWEEEAAARGGKKALFAVVNEQIGLYRKTGDATRAIERAEYALKLANEMSLSDSTAEATTLINAATAYKAFGRASDALPLYERATAIYQKELDAADERIGTLENNYALALAETGQYEKAEALFLSAARIMHENAMFPEEAISQLNLADLYEARDGAEAADEAIAACLDRAEELLDDPRNPRDGNYAFVCEKCHPTFDYFGRFFYAEELRERMRTIYERD